MTDENKPKPAIADGKTLAGKYPRGIDWDINIEKISLVEMFDRAVRKNRFRAAFDFFGNQMSYWELEIRANKAARGFQNMGVKKGTKVGFYMPNTQWHPVLFFGALKAGAVIVNYSTQYVEKELEQQIKDSGTTILVTADTPKPDTYGNAVNLLKKKSGLEQILVFHLADCMPEKDKSLVPDNMRWGLPLVKVMNRFKNFFNFAARGKVTYMKNFMDNDGTFRRIPVDPDDTAVLQYTGGTSGTPKGAELTHFNLTSNVQQITEFIGDSEWRPESKYTLKHGESRMFAPLPFFHVFGMTATMLTPIHMGLKTILALDPRDLETSLKIIERTRPDAGAAVPKLIESAMQSPLIHKYDHSSLKGIVTGGAAMPTGVHKEVHEKCNTRVFPGWGLTETSPVLTVNPLGENNKMGSAGQPVPGVSIRICDVNDPNKVLNMGEDGELQASGPNIMKGYLNNPEADAEVFVTDADGTRWFRTGDIGHLTDDMHVIITDRLKRMINVMGTGKKAWASVIENEIAEMKEVAECVVVAVNKGTKNESAKAFVRFKDGESLDEQAIKAHLETRLSKLEIPRYYEFVTEPLPVTAIGKPDWKKLEDMEAAKAKQDTPAPAPAPAP